MVGQHLLLGANGFLATTAYPLFAAYLSDSPFIPYSPRVPSPVVPYIAEVNVILMTL